MVGVAFCPTGVWDMGCFAHAAGILVPITNSMVSSKTAQTPSGQPAEVAPIVSAAKRLRAVRKACRQFLLMWAFEQGKMRGRPGGQMADEALADPANHDWTLLYRGSVLDD